MKTQKFLLPLAVFMYFSLNLLANNYYLDAVNGDDTNTGLAGAPWETIARLQTADLLPGDSVFFSRNQSFRGNFSTTSGTAAKHVFYGAYGTGTKPLLLGSVNRKEESEWTNVGTNLWASSGIVTQAGEAVDAGCIIFNNGSSVGWKVAELSLLVNQGKFYSNVADETVTMYSEENPGTVYSDIEIALKKGIIGIANKSYVDIENLELRYGAAHGINGGNSHHISIRKVDMKFIGGAYQTGLTRYGNGVEFWNNAHDNIVDRCTFSQIYDAALTNQGIMDEGEQYNIYYTNNLIDSCEYSFEIWLRNEGASMHDIYFENNTCIDAGMGWGNEQRRNPNGSHLCFWSYKASVSNIFIRNNIFSRVNGGGIFTLRFSDLSLATHTIDYNSWHVDHVVALMSGWDEEKSAPIHTFYGEEYYKESTGQGNNSIFNDQHLSGFEILPSSPCVNAGVTSEFVSADFAGVSRPQGLAYDIGAFELDASEIIVKIMPLGDSKTEGSGGSSYVSWRGFLRTDLMKAGYNIDYVGPRSNSAAGDGIPNDNDHAGFGGYSIGPDILVSSYEDKTMGVFEHIQDYFMVCDPDVVLLSLGVNDMFNPEDHVENYSKTAPERYKNLIDKIISFKPNVKIICGTVEPVGWGLDFTAPGSDLGILNDSIRALANRSNADNIFLAEIHDRFAETWVQDGPDFYDGVHFSEQGAKKVAAIWLEYIPDILRTTSVFSVTGVSVEHSVSFIVNESLQLTATFTPSNASNKTVSWSSSDTTIASVSQTGFVTGKSAGTAMVIVSTEDGSKTDTCIVTVLKKDVSEVNLDISRAFMDKGDTLRLKATIWPLDATNKNVIWSSLDTTIARVDSTGLVLAKSEGTTQIRVTTEDKKKIANCIITVNQVLGLSIKTSTFSIFPNPTTDILTIISNTSYFPEEIKIFNHFGTLVHSDQLKTSNKVNIYHLPRGIYFIQFSNFPTQLQKFVKI